MYDSVLNNILVCVLLIQTQLILAHLCQEDLLTYIPPGAGTSR